MLPRRESRLQERVRLPASAMATSCGCHASSDGCVIMILWYRQGAELLMMLVRGSRRKEGGRNRSPRARMDDLHKRSEIGMANASRSRPEPKVDHSARKAPWRRHINFHYSSTSPSSTNLSFLRVYSRRANGHMLLFFLRGVPTPFLDWNQIRDGSRHETADDGQKGCQPAFLRVFLRHHQLCCCSSAVEVNRFCFNSLQSHSLIRHSLILDHSSSHSFSSPHSSCISCYTQLLS